MTTAMKPFGVAIIGFGNTGRAAVRALEVAGDLELKGVVEISQCLQSNREKFPKLPFFDNIDEIADVDIAILCLPSRCVPEVASDLLQRGISTVDCFDVHGDDLMELKGDLAVIAKKNQVVSISAAGWDPGTDSVIRTLFEIAAPKGITYTNFGPGMSMGHTVAAKGISGVKKALSITLPEGFGFHKRCVYIECEDGASFDEIELNVRKDLYFIDDITHVIETDDIEKYADNGHSVEIQRKGAASQVSNQCFTFKATLTNSAVTAQIMVSAARAAMKQVPGHYLLPEIAPIDLLEGDDRNKLLRKLA
jgi:diaminopimelate dehydrogenase